MTSGAAGVIFYNNTILTETRRRQFGERALAEQPDPRRELRAGRFQREYESPTTARSDYNGFRVNPGADVSFQWTSPPWNVRGGLPRPAAWGR